MHVSQIGELMLEEKLHILINIVNLLRLNTFSWQVHLSLILILGLS